MKIVFKALEKDKMFSLSLLLAAVTSIFITPKITYINFKVIVLLFNLMLIVSALENQKLMDKIAFSLLKRCTDTRTLSLVFIIMTFFASMLLTNDVALLTFVPLCIITFKKTMLDPMKTIILQTLAANIGSSLTPMGNPQNLFLFTHYNLDGFQFFSATIPFVVFGMLWLILLNKRVLSKSVTTPCTELNISHGERTSVYLFLFGIIILSVFGVVDYKYALALTLGCVLFIDTHLLKKVDYMLLGTFMCFFLFIGNLSNIKIIQNLLTLYLQKPGMTYAASIVLSQFVSNVPCSILISGFTNNWREVLLGVNTGGMGTIIASLASLISYKIYVNENKAKNRHYLLKFNIYNFISLFVFAVFNYLWLL